MGSLFVASAVAVLVLALPGYLFFRALRFSNLTALAAAPLGSCMVYGVLPIIYDAADIPCDVLNMLVAPAAVFAAAALLSIRAARGKGATVIRPPAHAATWRRPGDFSDAGWEWATFGLYLLCGIAVCTITFIASLGAPDAFFSRYDNQTHLSLTQAFIDSGQWCALHHSRYAASLPNQIPLALSQGASFYPTCWHALVALICLVTGAKVTLASNALVAAVAAVAFPGGMYLLIRTLFPNRRDVVVAGALSTVAFATYPWVFAIKGPTFPNMLGYAVMVPFMAVFISYFERGIVRQALPGFIAFVLASFASMAIAHTNSLFTAFVFLAAYGGHYLNRAIRDARSIPAARKRPLRVGAMAAYLAAIAAFWTFCLVTPVLQGVVGYEHIENNGVLFSLKGLVELTLTINSFQFATLIACIVGAVACIRRRLWWILIPVGYMAIGYFIARVSWQPWLTIFMGLWYSLPYRAAACLCIFLMPVAALGIAETVRFCVRFVRKRASRHPKLGRYPQWAGVAAIALFLLATYPPIAVMVHGRVVQTPYNSVYYKLGEIYAQDGNRVYGADEVAFVDRAVEITGNALVLNQPNDGSTFAYGVNHMNTFYRSSAVRRQTDDSNELRLRIDEYATNPKVQAAVKHTDARYVLQLDQGVPYEELIKLPQFYEKNRDKWAGIDRIRDDTPGFTAVLSEGDMRLYRIDDPAAPSAAPGTGTESAASGGGR